MSLELSKKDKKIARELIEKGLQKEFEQGLLKMDRILQKWKDQQTDNRETYHNLYKTLTKFDKHISFRYDAISGSTCIFVLAAQLIDGLINEDDLSVLEQPVRDAILFIIQAR